MAVIFLLNLLVVYTFLFLESFLNSLPVHDNCQVECVPTDHTAMFIRVITELSIPVHSQQVLIKIIHYKV